MVSIPFKREGTFRPDTATEETDPAAENVSIPFKREGTFRPHTRITQKLSINCFNSLQTGRHIQTRPGTGTNFRIKVSIPFKREGTFRPTIERPRKSQSHQSFNSLQTGRHIQTTQTMDPRVEDIPVSFNSLQTGRHIQTGKTNGLIISLKF